MLSRTRLRLPIRLPELQPAAQGSIFYFGFYAAGGVYIPFLAVFFSLKGLSASEIGLLLAIGPLMALIVAPVVTTLADRRGWRVRTLGLALVLNALCLLAVPLAGSFSTLLLVVALLFAVGSPIGPIADGLIARQAARYNLAYGKMRMWGSLSWAVMAAVCAVAWQELGFSPMFPLAALLFLALAPFAWLLPEERPAEDQKRVPLRVVASDNRLRVLLAASLALGIGMSMAGTFAGLYLNRVGGGPLLVGLFSCVTAVSQLPTMHWSEGLGERLGGTRALLLGYLLFAISYTGLAFTGDPVVLLGLAVLQGLGFGLFLPVSVRMVSRWSPPRWTATSQGMLNLVLWGLSPLIAGPVGGVVYDEWGASRLFLVCTVVTLGAGLVLGVGQRAASRQVEMRAPEPVEPGC